MRIQMSQILVAATDARGTPVIREIIGGMDRLIDEGAPTFLCWCRATRGLVVLIRNETVRAPATSNGPNVPSSTSFLSVLRTGSKRSATRSQKPDQGWRGDASEQHIPIARPRTRASH